MSTFWSIWIIVLTLACLALVTWVLFANRKVAVRDDEEPENRTTGHSYDGIEEYDNPLPKWWFQLFVGTLVFSALYLLWYPGLGAFKGLGGWTSTNQFELEQGRAEEQHAQMYSEFLAMPIEELAENSAAMKMGVRLFGNNCAVCHGSDGGGAYGFPNLTDTEWLYGGLPENIKQSIVNGRNGNMPAWGPIIGEAKVAAVSEYVLSLSGAAHDAELAQQGVEVFSQNCAACHGVDASGNTALGAPNLADDVWLYAGTREAIKQSVRSGRANVMPMQQDKLQEGKIHLLAAYVYSLSAQD